MLGVKLRRLNMQWVRPGVWAGQPSLSEVSVRFVRVMLKILQVPNPRYRLVSAAMQFGPRWPVLNQCELCDALKAQSKMHRYIHPPLLKPMGA